MRALFTCKMQQPAGALPDLPEKGKKSNMPGWEGLLPSTLNSVWLCWDLFIPHPPPTKKKKKALQGLHSYNDLKDKNKKKSTEAGGSFWGGWNNPPAKVTQSTVLAGFVQRISALPLATATSSLPRAMPTPVPLPTTPLPWARESPASLRAPPRGVGAAAWDVPLKERARHAIGACFAWDGGA